MIPAGKEADVKEAHKLIVEKLGHAEVLIYNASTVVSPSGGEFGGGEGEGGDLNLPTCIADADCFIYLLGSAFAAKPALSASCFKY